MFRYLGKILLISFLAPLSFIWDWMMKMRRLLYKYDFIPRNSYRVPIISVGNLTFGGTGKTPFIIWMARYLETKKLRTMILMRGYKGQLESTSGILRSRSRLGHNPLEFGDEALLLSRKLPNASVVVGKRRSANLERYFYGEKPDCVLLDDGHQHLKLTRNLNIVLFDALMPITRYKTAPWGYLREGFFALKDADLVVISRADQIPLTQVNSLKMFLKAKLKSEIPFAEIGYKEAGIFNNCFEKVMDVAELSGKKVVCVAALASPLSFFKLVQNLGADIVNKYIFPDHHHYKFSDIDPIVAEARKEEYLIITTEKDMVKIRHLNLSQDFLYLAIDVSFLRGEEDVCQVIDRVFD